MDARWLQELLAPEWLDRARAEDQLLSWMIAQYSDDQELQFQPWPADVQSALAGLQPSPEVFLSALVAFWAEVPCHRRHGAAVPNAALRQRWTSPYTALCPMTSAELPQIAMGTRGMYVWQFIARLGPVAGVIEAQLRACLKHPDHAVSEGALLALGNLKEVSEAAFGALLQRCDGAHPSYQVARVIARHATPQRLPLLLDDFAGLGEGAQQGCCAAFACLTGDSAQRAVPALLQHLRLPLCAGSLFQLTRSLLVLAPETAADALIERLLPEVAAAAVECRCAAARALATIDPWRFQAELRVLAADQHYWVLIDLAAGLSMHPRPPEELLLALVQAALHCRDGHDDEPQYSALHLLKQSESRGIALPELNEWLLSMQYEYDLDRYARETVLDIADAAGAAASALLPGLQHLLWLATRQASPETLPALDQPGAFEVLHQHLVHAIVESGTPFEAAEQVASAQTELTRSFIAGMEEAQAEIDADEAAWAAERAALYPEWAAGQEEEPEAAEAANASVDDDETVVRLRTTIRRLSVTPFD